MGGRGSSSGLHFAALGPKGKPKSIEDAMKGANPHFMEPGTGKQYTHNCQRCIYAYEMQRRGYDVEAMPRILDGSDTLPYMYHAQGWTQVMEGAQLVDLPSRNTLQKMVDQMAKWGDGARAVVRLAWKGGRSGHVVIAEQQHGGTVFLDPQTGRYIDIKWNLDQAIKGETKLMRVDNLKPTALIEKCVKQRGK